MVYLYVSEIKMGTKARELSAEVESKMDYCGKRLYI